MGFQKQIQFQAHDLVKDLYGSQNRNLKKLESGADVQIHVRGNVATITGKKGNVEKAVETLEGLYSLLSKGNGVEMPDIDQALEIIREGGIKAFESVYQNSIAINGKFQSIVPKTLGQKEYINAIRTQDMVFGIGPAGTGKTYLAIGMAVEAYHKKLCKRIILTRPAVEAGEKLGFLPGDLAEKVDPYLRPIYDALFEMMDQDKVNRLLERNTIEVAPLAFMRGRTLNDAFVILDEAQNTTSEQMKMFLTRIGQGTQAVITGDITQIDLPNGAISGLVEARDLLKNIEGLSFCYFSEKDVVRHRLVREIIKAYERKS